MRVLLSIKPEFVDRIVDGSKRFEFRRRPYLNKSVQTVVIYSTKPVGKIVGEFDVERIISDTPDELWKKTSNLSGISRIFYDEYFEGRIIAYALQIGEVRVYDNPIVPSDFIENFTPPQSYMYVNDGPPSEWRQSEQLPLL